jgi:hypothetical protein
MQIHTKHVQIYTLTHTDTHGEVIELTRQVHALEISFNLDTHTHTHTHIHAYTNAYRNRTSAEREKSTVTIVKKKT